MKKCKICNDQPKEIWSQAGYTYICKPCMEEHGNTNHDKIGTGKYPNNYIPSDYYRLIDNKERVMHKGKKIADNAEDLFTKMLGKA